MDFDADRFYDGCRAWWEAGAPYLAALAVTLVLAAWLTPRRWWRRPNLQALAVLGGGTLAFGALFAALFAPSFAASAGTSVAGERAPQAALALADGTAPSRAAAASRPAPGASYRVAYALNLRRAGGVHAPRVAVLPAGALVVATGAVDGDWWQVRFHEGGAPEEGWASSLWLRRTDEGGPGPLE